MNITDIDDKIIKRSNELNEEFTAFSRKWENQFFEDMKFLYLLRYSVKVIKIGFWACKHPTF